MVVKLSEKAKGIAASQVDGLLDGLLEEEPHSMVTEFIRLTRGNFLTAIAKSLGYDYMINDRSMTNFQNGEEFYNIFNRSAVVQSKDPVATKYVGGEPVEREIDAK